MNNMTRPYHNINMPRIALVGEPMGGARLYLYRLWRGLRRMVATSPEIPPTMCTGPAPAMSTTPITCSHPFLPHTQCAGKQYTKVFSKENKMYASSFVLSAIAPVKENIPVLLIVIVAKGTCHLYYCLLCLLLFMTCWMCLSCKVGNNIYNLSYNET